MPYHTSTATVDDLDQVAQLIDDYVRQNLNMPSWPCPLATFKRDYASGCFRMTVIHCDQKLVGFAAWLPHYDLHHCAHGAECIDMYVDPAYRCRGLGVALLCAISADITTLGWTYLRGTALSGRASRLYARVGVCFGTNEYNLSGKALRQLAGLAGKAPREILQGLPSQEMNYQP